MRILLDEPAVLVVEDWTYRAEGNLHVLLMYHGAMESFRHHLMRLRKVIIGPGSIEMNEDALVQSAQLSRTMVQFLFGHDYSHDPVLCHST